MTEPHGPLHGVKVVSCSTAQAGTVPYMLMADLGADVIKIETPDGGDNSRVSSVLPGMPSTFFETNNRGVKSVTLNLKTAGGARDPAQAGRRGRHLRPELPARRRREERLRLGGPAQGQSEARLHVDLGLRTERTECAPAGHRLDGAGAGRHRAGLWNAGPAAEDRRRLRGRRDLRHPRLRRRAGGADPCARHRRRPEGRLLAARRTDPADGLDADDGDVAQPRSGHRPGPRRRHARAAGDVGELQRQGRQAASSCSSRAISGRRRWSRSASTRRWSRPASASSASPWSRTRCARRC